MPKFDALQFAHPQCFGERIRYKGDPLRANAHVYT
jgi:hypothetical protein